MILDSQRVQGYFVGVSLDEKVSFISRIDIQQMHKWIDFFLDFNVKSASGQISERTIMQLWLNLCL